MTINLEYLKGRLSAAKHECSVDLDCAFAEQILASTSFEERATSLERYLVSYAINRSRSRAAFAEESDLEVYGLESLIKVLEKVDPDSYIDFYEVATDKYAGTFFVYMCELVGYGFVRRGSGSSRRGLWLNGEQEQ
ncbi:hypothetical protein [Microbulbifer sp.]|uniref:hypothetical protein n=1 Tax=Microbulbifer sp. TaxID=1908541 RepID=UPI003F35765F